MLLVQPFLNRDSSLERVRAYCDRAQSISSFSLKELRRLLIIHESYHEWRNAIPYVLHPIMATGFGTLEEMASGSTAHLSLEMTEPYQGLVACLRALSSISEFIHYAQALFRLLAQACQTLGIRLPYEIARELGLYQSAQWTKDAASTVSSQYVADMRSAVTDIDNKRMDTVIAEWDALTISEKSSAGAKDKTEG